MIATRDGFGEELVRLGKANERIVVVSADLEDATRAEYFKTAFPGRFFSMGIAEQDMVGTAAGLSLMGFIPFINSFAVFLTNRAYDMLRMDLCYNNCNVKIVCSHAGLTVGEDGASAQCLEDLALMRVLPNMVVICPVDTIEAQKATRAIAAKGPMYLRTSRAPLPVLTKESDPFKIGKANILREGKDVTIIGCGTMVSESLQAAEILGKEKNQRPGRQHAHDQTHRRRYDHPLRQRNRSHRQRRGTPNQWRIRKRDRGSFGPAVSDPHGNGGSAGHLRRIRFAAGIIKGLSFKRRRYRHSGEKSYPTKEEVTPHG